MLNKIRDHPTHTALAIGMVAIGLFLLINDHYFVWPPHYSEWLNDDIVGFLFVIDGLGIGGWALWETQPSAQDQINVQLLKQTAQNAAANAAIMKQLATITATETTKGAE